MPNRENGDFVTTNENLYGSVAQLTCHAGFLLVGDAVITCLENKTWNGTWPSCQHKGHLLFDAKYTYMYLCISGQLYDLRLSGFIKIVAYLIEVVLTVIIDRFNITKRHSVPIYYQSFF